MNLPAKAQLSCGAILISFAAIFVKMIDPQAMGPTAIGFWRAGLGSAVLFLWALLAGAKLNLTRPMLLWTVLAGFVFYLDLFFWHRSIVYSGAGLATMLATTQVFVTATFGVLLFNERLTLRVFLAAVAGVVGVTLLVGVGSGVVFSERYLLGVMYGLLTGLAYGSYIVILKSVAVRYANPDFKVVMAWTSLFTTIFLALSGVIEGDSLRPPDWFSFGNLAALAVSAQVLGWWIISTNMPRIRTAHGSLILLLQPVLATLWGFLIFHETLNLWQVLGGVTTLVAIYVGSAKRGH